MHAPRHRGARRLSAEGPGRLTGEDLLARRLAQACMLRGSFTLRSGSVSDRYFDKYLFASDPVLLSEVADRLAPLIPRGTEVLAGLELGGVPVDTALCVLDRSDGHPDPQQEMGITLISLSTAQDVGW